MLFAQKVRLTFYVNNVSSNIAYIAGYFSCFEDDTMSKKSLLVPALFFVVIVILAVKIFSTEKPEENIEAPQAPATGGQQTYIVGQSPAGQTTIYGNVVATSISSLSASTAGVVSSLQCQPGRAVKKGDLIATIAPANDLQMENNRIQQFYLGQQSNLMQAGLNATLSNLGLQQQSLLNQKNVAEQQIALLQANLSALQQQKNLSNADVSIQIQTAQTSLANLKTLQDQDLSKIETSLLNQKKSLQNSVQISLELFDQTFGMTNPSKATNRNIYLGANDPSAKSEVVTRYNDMVARADRLLSMSSVEAAIFMSDAVTFFSLTAQVVGNSLPDGTYLPQTQIDAWYKAFTDTANGLLSAKTAYDNLLSSYDITKTNYNTQITTTQNNLNSLIANKGPANNLTLQTQINQLQSQLASAQLSLRSTQDALNGFGNTQLIQTQQAKGQLLSTQQSLATLSNSLKGEKLYAPVDGIVRSVNVQLSNRVTAGALVCQISPAGADTLKIQVYSSSLLSDETVVFFYDQNNTLLGTGNYLLKMPYKDLLTQNYIYELISFPFNVTEGQKLIASFAEENNTDEIWIPLSYITPRLEGYYVKKLINNQPMDVAVAVGTIHKDSIRILSGVML